MKQKKDYSRVRKKICKDGTENGRESNWFRDISWIMSSRFDYSQWMITPTNNRMKWFHSNRNNHICHFSNHLLNVVNVKPSARFHFFIPFFFLFLRLNVICTQKAAIRPHLFLRIIEGKKVKCGEDKPFGNDEFVGRFSVKFILFGCFFFIHRNRFMNARWILSGKSKFVQSKMEMRIQILDFKAFENRKNFIFLSLGRLLKHCVHALKPWTSYILPSTTHITYYVTLIMIIK